MVRRSVVAGCGAYLPERIVTNEELARKVDTSDEWIMQRTGIRQRHVAHKDERTSDLALAAARQAIENAGLKPNDIDIIVLATATPDETFPATATRVQAELGMTRGAAFDIQAVCSGFIFGLNIADNFIKVEQADNVLVIGAETFSRILDWTDRATCVLFGDGAGAVVLRAAEGKGTNQDRGFLSHHLHSDGRYHDLLFVDGGPSSTRTVGHLRMAGREVFRHAVVNLSQVIGEALACNDLTRDDIDWLVPHQANRRILEGTANKLKLPMERVVLTVDRHANTSAASIPLALADVCAQGRFNTGDLLILEAMGGGFAWGASILRW